MPEVLLPRMWRDGQWDARSRVISAVAVEPEHRRQGLAKALIERRIELWGHPPVFAHCVEGSGSRAVFAALGFQPVLRVERFYAKTTAMTLMRISPAM